MVTKELIEKARKCNSKEELLALAKSENIELCDEDADKLIPFIGTNKELSDDELDNVAGGTCYGDGWDGTDRPIVTDSNSCGLYKVVAGGKPSWSVICPNCMYYSGRVDGKTISAFSGWCTNPDRIEGHDVINED